MTTDLTKLEQSLKRRAYSANEFGESLYVKADDVLALIEALEAKNAECHRLSDELRGATAHVALLKIDARELVKEARDKDARIAEQTETIAKQEKWIRGIEESMINANDRAEEWERKAISNFEACSELQSRAESAEKSLSNLATVSRRYLPRCRRRSPKR
ncbi:hypothetical protein R0595_000729 [Pluralibacter gergoviae]|nr:hypothetical protein [Pluralibacter gergoviae]ELW9442873.1 hypothetical protein [Pluralibacter gergoviae]